MDKNRILISRSLISWAPWNSVRHNPEVCCAILWDEFGKDGYICGVNGEPRHFSAWIEADHDIDYDDQRAIKQRVFKALDIWGAYGTHSSVAKLESAIKRGNALYQQWRESIAMGSSGEAVNGG